MLKLITSMSQTTRHTWSKCQTVTEVTLQTPRSSGRNATLCGTWLFRVVICCAFLFRLYDAFIIYDIKSLIRLLQVSAPPPPPNPVSRSLLLTFASSNRCLTFCSHRFSHAAITFLGSYHTFSQSFRLLHTDCCGWMGVGLVFEA